MENPIKIDDLGVPRYPYFWKHPYIYITQPTITMVMITSMFATKYPLYIQSRKLKRYDWYDWMSTVGGLP